MKPNELAQLFPGKILDLPYPKPYPPEIPYPSRIKAIVLGCDPSNFSQDGRNPKILETVFGLEGMGKDGRYFAATKQNLKELDIEMEDIYVQNLCRNYFSAETEQNPIWYQAAEYWIPLLVRELEDLRIPLNIPVFLTSRHLYKALIREGVPCHEPKVLYANPHLVPIPASDSRLSRTLIPLYRGGIDEYKLSKKTDYRDHVKKVIAGLQNKNVK